MASIEAGTIAEIHSAAYDFLKSIVDLYDNMVKEFIEQPQPTNDSLSGTYEELWSNYRNKIIASVNLNDKSYAYHAAMGAQNFLDEMTKTRGTKIFDLMQYFDTERLELFKEQFLLAMDEYLLEYGRVGLKVERYDTFEQLYEHYMSHAVR
ncbi:hypothetical protein GCM10010912_50980 [Paenibacillus albidus]|uniref:Uncharacterized protein n=1 Tax=Paenibacillus albidus TaxID=2041023 RepID=A0A917FQK9_9BACL|nr:hypothetical protein [Paenibacillus albidus]GGF99943.1 hypothetical protein GCM10010912_50980 [Paenibacillus albidus]